ncbi:phage portal protein [Lysobacter korlensis]|uniref:Phage portal protein n=1 Tax=Lysobacter korlensis TaxID=553636 RepID=A0ABV6RNQ2_9GAMM
MARDLKFWRGWFGGSALAERTGDQHAPPGAALVDGTASVGPDGAMQIAAVWACIDRRAMTIAALPLFTYTTDADGQKTLARGSRLYQLLHDSPNARMTPLEFWRAMLMNYDLRGNAYARIDRDERTGEAIALWPMPADQVRVSVLDDGSMVYEYRVGSDVAVLAESNVLHLKNLGNGTTGLAKLEFMRASTDEAAKAQTSASKTFGNGGKPTGVLMIDKALTDPQREKVRESFRGLTDGSTSRLMVLEHAMTYQQLSLTPEQQQILETRKYGIEEFCRWFDVPPVLIYHSNVTVWGSGITEIVSGWYRTSIGPLCVMAEQAIRKRVLTPRQRATMSVEFSTDALLRASLKDRIEIYGKGIAAGVYKPNDCRQLENLSPEEGGDRLLIQSALIPLAMAGQKTAPGGGTDASTQAPRAD